MSADRTEPLSADEVLTRATEETGLDDFGEHGDEFVDQFHILVDCMNRDADIRPSSRRNAMARLGNTLRGRLRLMNDRRTIPEIMKEEIVRPIVIIGAPRAGSTFLHSLFAADPRNRIPHAWEVTFPSPPPEGATFSVDPRIAQCDAYFESLGQLNPRLQAIKPETATSPYESGGIREFMWTGYVGIWWNVPTFAQMVGLGPTRKLSFEFERDFLKHLQYRHPGERWVLKNPAATRGFQHFFDVFPDAFVVVTHRTPVKVVPSVVSLLKEMRRVYSDTLPDPRRSVLERVSMMTEEFNRLIELRAAADREDQFFDCHFKDLVADPVNTLFGIYDKAGIDLPEHVVKQVETFVQQDPRTKGSRHRYPADPGGLSKADILDTFHAYMEHYGVDHAA